MLFFTRACLCIGAVVVLAEGFAPDDLATRSHEAAGTLLRSAAEQAAALCRTRPAECLAVAAAPAARTAIGGPAGAATAQRPDAAGRPAVRHARGKAAELSLRHAAPK